MYNMQSGILRKTFNIGPCPPEVDSRFRPSGTSKKKLEERCVTGLVSDALNATVIASTLDGTINVGPRAHSSLLYLTRLCSFSISIQPS